jgi:hypothetical protein
MFYNWEKPHGLNDLQNAKFISLIDADGKLPNLDEGKPNIRDTARYIGCSPFQLRSLLKRMKSANYQFPLQRWEKSYVLFQPHKSAFEGTFEELNQSIVKALSRMRTHVPDSLSVNVKSKYYIANHIQNKEDGILDILMRTNIFETIHRVARQFVIDNRSLSELNLFDRLFANKLPRDCFFNYYPADSMAGVNVHRDQTSFCTVVLCLFGTPEGNLVLTRETNETETVHLQTNDIIVSARIDHFVEEAIRTECRITLNAFF